MRACCSHAIRNIRLSLDEERFQEFPEMAPNEQKEPNESAVHLSSIVCLDN